MDAESKRKRAVNFTEAEKVILTDLVFRYKNMIENKRTDAITCKDKDKAWKVIEQLFNSMCSIIIVVTIDNNSISIII